MLNAQQDGTGQVQSVVRALEILEGLGQSEDGLGVTALAKATGLKVPTAHNLLRTLVAKGYVARDAATPRYRLGACCASIGRAYQRNLRVPDISRPIVRELAGRVNESVVVAMMEGGEIRFVMQASGDRLLTVSLGRPVSPSGYISVCGRVLLAHLPKHQLEDYIAAHPVEDSGCEDISTREDLDAILDQARRNGYLDYWRENGTVLAIAAPIRDFTGEVVAAIGLGMPSVRYKESELGTVIEAVKNAARRISIDLGLGTEE